MDTTQLNVTELISQSINSLLNNLFTSIDENIYAVLDTITFIDSNIIKEPIFTTLYGTSNNIGILLIANSLLIGFIIFYIIRYFSSSFISSQIEQPFQFFFKCIILGIIMNNSLYIWTYILDFNNLLTLLIGELGENIFNLTISFEELIKKINIVSIVSENTFNLFSFNGMIKSFASFGLINLLFSYSLRYVMLKVFILITPFSILSLLNNSTSWFFKSWLKCLLSLLLLQNLISLILLIIFSIHFFSNDSISKLIFIGSIYSLIKANQFLKEIIGGITTDFNINLTNLKQKF